MNLAEFEELPIREQNACIYEMLVCFIEPQLDRVLEVLEGGEEE